MKACGCWGFCCFSCLGFCCFSCLAGWLVGWLAGWLVGWLAGWLVGCVLVMIWFCFAFFSFVGWIVVGSVRTGLTQDWESAVCCGPFLWSLAKGGSPFVFSKMFQS